MAKKKTNQNVNAMATLKKVLTYIGRYRIFVVISLLMALITVLSSLYVPILVGRAIDEIVGPGQVDFSDVFRVLITIGVVIGCTALSQWLMNVCNNKITYQVSRDIRDRAIEKIEHLPLSYLDSHKSGEITSRMIADVDQFTNGLLMGFTQFFTGLLTIIGTLCFMLSVNVLIALVVIVLTPMSLLVARFIAKRSYAMFRAQSETRGEQTALIDEMIMGQKEVQAFSRQAETQERFDEINGRLRTYSFKATFYSSLVNPSTRFVNAIVYAGVAVVGALIAISGGITVGSLSCFLSYANQYTKPFNDISAVITELQNALACAARVLELIEEEAEVPEADKELGEADGSVSLDHVAFSYDPEVSLIEDLSLSVRPGQKIAIVGPTGCGKTTLINLLMRFYDVDKGSIFVSGKDIREITRHSLRAGYGMVLQDTYLFAGTIRDNIKMGRPEATDEEMLSASRAAHAHEFIRRLSQGYDTVIGEDGGSLSQGQKQLLCITRVMLCHPPMLILDEATSSIDTRTELLIQEAFDRLMEGRTSFIVAHRLSTIRSADLILVMKDGHIIEQGDHKSLLEKKGFYYELYRSQFEE